MRSRHHMRHHYCTTCDRRIETPRLGGVECFACELHRARQSVPLELLAFWDGWFAGLEGWGAQEMPYPVVTQEARDWVRAHRLACECFWGRVRWQS